MSTAYLDGCILFFYMRQFFIPHCEEGMLNIIETIASCDVLYRSDYYHPHVLTSGKFTGQRHGQNHAAHWWVFLKLLITLNWLIIITVDRQLNPTEKIIFLNLLLKFQFTRSVYFPISSKLEEI